MNYTTQQQCAIWLSSIEGIGTKRYAELCAFYGSPQGVFEQADRSGLSRMEGIGEKLAGLILSAKTQARLEDAISELERKNIVAFTQDREEYPELLRNLFDPPPVLYVKSSYPMFSSQAISIVGSRKCTRYGRDQAHMLGKELADAGVTVVSGMARGIDTAAHMGAIESGGYTIAVLGCGVDVIYPPENKRIYDQIIECGAVVSDYFPGTAPLANHFPARNRIISGLSRGVVAVECGKKSGASITVNFALEQGKDVFAVPANIDSPASVCSNELLRQGAIPVLKTEHVLMEYPDWQKDLPAASDVSHPLQLDAFETAVYEKLYQGPMFYDELAASVDLDNAQLAACLTMMELKGIIKQLPARAYELVKWME